MLDDLVIDTNIFLHAQTPSGAYFEDARTFIDLFLTKNTVLCVDPGFDVNEGLNRSHIGGEYLRKILPGSVAFAALVQIASSQRIKLVSRNPGNRVRRKIDQLIRKPMDRSFLRVAHNSDSKILVSHDHEDFQIAKRPNILKETSVSVILASECSPLL